jgi:hypothetical protein
LLATPVCVCVGQCHSSGCRPQHMRIEARLCTVGRRCALRDGAPQALPGRPLCPTAACHAKQAHQALSCMVSAVAYACIGQGYWRCLGHSSMGHSCRTGSAGMAGCVPCHMPSCAGSCVGPSPVAAARATIFDGLSMGCHNTQSLLAGYKLCVPCTGSRVHPGLGMRRWVGWAGWRDRNRWGACLRLSTGCPAWDQSCGEAHALLGEAAPMAAAASYSRGRAARRKALWLAGRPRHARGLFQLLPRCEVLLLSFIV